MFHMDDNIAALNKTIHVISDLIVGPTEVRQHYSGEVKTICDDSPKGNGKCVKKEVPIIDTITETPKETIIFKNFNFEFPSQKRKNNFDEEQNGKRMKIEDDNDLKAFNYMTGTYETVEATTTEFLEEFEEFKEELTSPEENALALEESTWVEEEQTEKPSQLKEHNSTGVKGVNALTTQNINFNNGIVKNDSLENSVSFTHLTNVLPKTTVKEHSSITLLERLLKEDSPVKNKSKESSEYCNKRSLLPNVSIKQTNKPSCNKDFTISSIIPSELGKQSLLLNYLTSNFVNPLPLTTSKCSTITIYKTIVKTIRNSEKTYNEEILKVTKPEILKGGFCHTCGYYSKKPSHYKRHKNSVISCQLYLKKNGKLLGLNKKTLVVVLCREDFCICQNMYG